MIVLLDSGPLGRIANPNHGKNRDLHSWLASLIAAHVSVLVPEICDYEVRRELVRSKSAEGLKRLDTLRIAPGLLPLNSAMMLKAAELWADARNSGMPTAHDHALDCDVILAAQALSVGGIIATENVGHLSRYADARIWRDIKAPV